MTEKAKVAGMDIPTIIRLLKDIPASFPVNFSTRFALGRASQLLKSIDIIEQKNNRLREGNKMDTMEFLEKTDVETMFPVVLLKKLEEENAKLREALEWYGDEKRYYWEPIFGPGEIDFDKGEKARKALGRPE